MASLSDTIETVLGCVCDALSVAERPVCHCYQVVGTPMWRPCCDCTDCATCSDSASGELVAWVENLYPVDQNLQPSLRIESCRRGAWAADIALQLTRCYPAVTEDAQLPDPDALDVVAREFNEDLTALRKALTCCSGVRLVWRSLGAETPPEGGCSYLTAHVTVGIE